MKNYKSRTTFNFEGFQEKLLEEIIYGKDVLGKGGILTLSNNIENFWGTLKRGILGIYHHVSAKHLHKYVDEFCLRYNNRSNDNMFNLLVKQAVL